MKLMQEQLEVVTIRLKKDAPIMSNRPIHSPMDAIRLLGKELCELDREVICIVNLRTDGIPLNCNFVSVGVVDQSIAHPREIFKSSILSNATSMILIHNHPSGNLEPSKWDTILTDRMLKLGELIGIPVKKVDTMCKKYIIVLSVIIILKVINTLLSVWIVVKTQ